MPVWVLIGLVVAVVLAVAAYQELRPKSDRQRPLVAPPGRTPQPLPARPVPGALLSPAEAEFFGVLRQAVGQRYVPLAKVQLLALAPGLTSHPSRAELLQRSADFVLLEAESLQPVLVLQFEGPRDGAVALVLQRSGLAVVEVSGQVEWTPRSLAMVIADALARPSRP